MLDMIFDIGIIGNTSERRWIPRKDSRTAKAVPRCSQSWDMHARAVRYVLSTLLHCSDNRSDHTQYIMSHACGCTIRLRGTKYPLWRLQKRKEG